MKRSRLEAVSRRQFLAGSTTAAGLAVLAVACSGDADDPGTAFGPGGPSGDIIPTRPAGAESDLDIAAAVAGLEKLAFDTYAALGQLGTAGLLGAALPPAIFSLMSTGARQHREALDAWNAMLAHGGRPTVTAPNPVLKPAVDAAAAKLADVLAAATLVLRLENYASQTYQKAIPTLRSGEAIRLAAQVAVVGSQRQAVLRYILGLPPVGSGTARESTDFAPADPKLSLITG